MTSMHIPEYVPPCPDCGDTGLTTHYTGWGDSQVEITGFCQCDTGEQMRVDYETDQVGREEDEREGREIGG